MSSPQPRGPCPEVGTLATQILGGMVLLCLAANAISLLCLQPRRLRSSVRYEAHKGAERSRRAKRARANSTCRCSAGPWGLAWRREHKATQTGRDRGGSVSESVSLRQLRLAACADTKASEHSSSWLGTATVLEQRGTRPAGLPRNRSVSPRGRPPPARPARIVLCSLRPGSEGELPAPAKEGSDATLGQVIYDARWLHCMMGKNRGNSPTVGQRESQQGASCRGASCLGPPKAAGCRRRPGPRQ